MCVYVFELDILFIGVFVVVSYSSISLGVSTFLLCNLVFGPQYVFVMSRTCNNVEFDCGLSSKHEAVPLSNTMRDKQSGAASFCKSDSLMATFFLLRYNSSKSLHVFL